MIRIQWVQFLKENDRVLRWEVVTDAQMHNGESTECH